MTSYCNERSHSHRTRPDFRSRQLAQGAEPPTRAATEVCACIRPRIPCAHDKRRPTRTNRHARLRSKTADRPSSTNKRLDARTSRRRKRIVTWIVDTCVVLDVFEGDPQFGKASAKLLQRLLPFGLAVSPVTMVELSAAFTGDMSEQKRFLEQCGISHSEAWTVADTEASHRAWTAYVKARRAERIPKRPVADILIGGIALNRKGLITRNASDFRRWFPRLSIREP